MKNDPFFFYTFLFLIVCSASMHAQPLLDTIDGSFKEQLLQYYDRQGVAAQNFTKQIPQKQIRKSFAKIASYKKADFVDEVSRGKFIYHQQYSPFFESIFTNLKQNNPQLIDEDYKIVLTTDPNAEAFSMENGIIGIDLSLLRHFENEYQVAFTIAHETAHQVLGHGNKFIISYLESRKSEELKKELESIQKQEYNQIKNLIPVIKRIAYTDADKRRKYEQQADSLGFLMYRKAYPGHEQEALETLRILKGIASSNDSIAQVDFGNIFGVNGLKFNKSWLEDEDTKSYVYKKKQALFDEDSLRTHYDADSRIQFLKKEFLINANPEGKSVTYSALIRHSNAEFIFELYFRKNYGESLYQTLLSLKDDLNDRFLKKMLYDNLVQLQKARNSYTLNKYLPNPSPEHTDSYNQYVCLLRNLNKDELDQMITYYKY